MEFMIGAWLVIMVAVLAGTWLWHTVRARLHVRHLLEEWAADIRSDGANDA